MQECTLCREVKKVDEFSLRNTGKRRARCKQCEARLQRIRRSGDFGTLGLKSVDALFRCSRCGFAKPRSEFSKGDRKRDLSSQCRPCRSDAHRLRNYGISTEIFLEILGAQNYQCAVCFGPLDESTALIDHDHATGEVRGLLDQNCNFLLGHAKDDVRTLRNAITYLGG